MENDMTKTMSEIDLAAHAEELGKLLDVGLLVIHRRDGDIILTSPFPNDPGVALGPATLERVVLLHECGQMAREANETGQPAKVIDAIVAFGMSIPRMPDSEVREQLGAMVEPRRTLH
jgi:hypothetical protein